LTRTTKRTTWLAAASLTMTAGFILKERTLGVKTKSRSSLLDDVRRAVSDARHGPATWYERLAPEHREELDAIKAEWKAGELGSRKKTLARALAENMCVRGISDVGTQGVLTWLEKA
jgi:hypothetical protein